MSPPGRHVLYLSKRIGSREGGSEGERAASIYIASVMKKTDREIRLQHFSCWRSDIPSLIIILAFSVIAYILFLPAPRISFLLASVAFIVFQMETYSWALISKMLPRRRATNLIQIVPPKNENNLKFPKRVILTANYDSSRTSPFGNRTLARAYRFMYILLFLCILGLTGVSVVGIAGELAKFSSRILRVIWYFSSPLAGYILIFTIILSWGEIFGRTSPGANDNAAGVAVMLSLLEGINQSPFENTEVWFVATARGFAGGRGMVELIKKNRKTLKGAYVLNIDHPGRGEIRLLKREGPIFGFSPGKKLKKISKKAARSIGSDIGFSSCRVKKSDAMVAQARGISAITICAMSGSTYPGWRSRNDTYDVIDQSLLDKVKSLALAIIKEIDAS